MNAGVRGAWRVAAALLAFGAASACDLCAVSSSLETSAPVTAAPASDVPPPDAAVIGGSSGGSAPPTLIEAPVVVAPRRALLAGLSLGVLPTWTEERSPYAGTRRIADDADQRVTTAEADLFVAWRFSERVGVRAYVPLVYRSWHRLLGDGSAEDRWLGGLGDAQLEGTWTIARGDARRAGVLTLFAGVQLPTGGDAQLGQHVGISSAYVPADAGGHVHDGATHLALGSGSTPLVHGHDIALGTGAWGGIGGASAFVGGGAWFATAHGEVVATATNPDGYRMGDHVMWGGGPGAYLWRGARGRVGLQANCSGEWRDVDAQEGGTVSDTGRFVVYLGPDLSLVWGRGLSAELGLDLPVLRRADGEQLLPTWRAHAGVAYAW